VWTRTRPRLARRRRPAGDGLALGELPRLKVLDLTDTGVHRDVPAGVAGVAAAAATRAALFLAGLFTALEEVSMGGTARRARG
jgi:hypothetical protein